MRPGAGHRSDHILPDPQTATIEEDYDVSFDPVTPDKRDLSHQNTLITNADDAFPQRAGLQVAFEVQLVDPRPASVDYDLIIDCGNGNQSCEHGEVGDRNDALNRGEMVETGSGVFTGTVMPLYG